MALSLKLRDDILDEVVREAGLRSQRHEGADSKDPSGEHKRGLLSEPPWVRKEAGMVGKGIGGGHGCANLILSSQGGPPVREAAGGVPIWTPLPASFVGS